MRNFLKKLLKLLNIADQLCFSLRIIVETFTMPTEFRNIALSDVAA